MAEVSPRTGAAVRGIAAVSAIVSAAHGAVPRRPGGPARGVSDFRVWRGGPRPAPVRRRLRARPVVCSFCARVISATQRRLVLRGAVRAPTVSQPSQAETIPPISRCVWMLLSARTPVAEAFSSSRPSRSPAPSFDDAVLAAPSMVVTVVEFDVRVGFDTPFVGAQTWRGIFCEAGGAFLVLWRQFSRW